jgi:biotin synthase
VSWPQYELGEIVPSLAAHAARGDFGRVCVQTVAGGEAVADLERLLHQLKPRVPLPVSASVHVREAAALGPPFAAGLDRAALALDAASEGTYAAVKGGSLKAAKAVLAEAARAYPGRLSTHLIVGLGETEEEAVRLLQWCADRGVTAGLFAFTPVRGTRFASRAAPELASFRRVQVARQLIRVGLRSAAEMGFEGGRLVSFGLGAEDLALALGDGQAFRTSGCPACNRPYYNERPGATPYNYPRPLSALELRLALRELPGLAGAGEGVAP